MKNTMTKVAALAVIAVGAMATPALAAQQSGPTGTIAVAGTDLTGFSAASAPALQYNGNVGFDTSVAGRVSSKAQVYIRVLCWQGDRIVYQWSADPGFTFPLVDQAGQGLEWDGGAASCTGELIYRVEKGSSVEMTVLATVGFDVASTAS